MVIFNNSKLIPLMEQLYLDASNDLGNWHWIKFGTQRIGFKISGNVPLDYVYLQRSLRSKNPRCPNNEELIQIISALPHAYGYSQMAFWTETTGNWCRLNAWLQP